MSPTTENKAKIKLVLPIMNGSISLLRGPTHYLDTNAWIDKLTDEEYGILSKAPAEYSSAIRINHRCIFLSIDDGENPETVAPLVATSCRYVFNNFRSESPFILPFAFVIKPKTKGTGMTVTDTFELSDDIRHAARSEAYKLREGLSREDISGFYRIVKNACERHKKLRMTLNRFNSALVRPKFSDRVIDATISLESMVQDDKTELSFKFSLFNSYAANKSAEKRAESFELFRKLYITRSYIVHGAADENKEARLLREIEQNWTKIEENSRRAINELIFYVQNNDPSNWTKYLLERVISAEPKHEGRSQ
ncbi:hypothetical protein KXR94_04165 [Stutzerimonas stutzeri]